MVKTFSRPKQLALNYITIVDRFPNLPMQGAKKYLENTLHTISSKILKQEFLKTPSFHHDLYTVLQAMFANAAQFLKPSGSFPRVKSAESDWKL